jgi:sorbitol/mannitol transport system permease protein
MAAVTGTERAVGSSRLGNMVLGMLAWIAALVFFFPVFWMFITGFKHEAQATTRPPQLFFTPTVEQFAAVFDRGIGPYLLNSLMATLISVLVVILLALPAAYALSIRPVEKWRDALFFFLSTRFMPFVAAIVPIYIIARNIGMLDNVYTLVILYTGMNLPIAVWMLRSFLSEIPQEILEAARVDGAPLRVEFTRILLPLIAPGLAATALITFIFAWNEFFFAVNLTSTRAPTVPVFLVGFITSEGLFWARLSAASTLATLPVILVGWVAQKQLVRGLTMGAVK